jgi:DNA replication protein DnaC
MRFFAGPTLLVIDELGYLPLPAEAAAALSDVISQRYLTTSIVITTNRGVGACVLDRNLSRGKWPPPSA